MLDCTPDCAHEEQLVIILRYVSISEQISINESFFEFCKITHSTGAAISKLVLEQLVKFGLDFQNCRAQAYDNGAKMRGEHKGVQAILSQKNPKALFLPCCNHNLNLVITDAVKSNFTIPEFFGIIQNLYNLFAASTKRWDIINSKLHLTLKPLSDTRWEAQYNCIHAVYSDLPDVLMSLDELLKLQGLDDGSVAQCLGIRRGINLKFAFQLIFWHNILEKSNKLCNLLQLKASHLDDAMSLINQFKTFIKDFRTDSNFNNIFVNAQVLCTSCGIKNVLSSKRVSKKKKFADEHADDEPIRDPSRRLKMDIFFAILDVISNSLDDRFQTLFNYRNLYGFLLNINESHKNGKICENAAKTFLKILMTLNPMNSRQIFEQSGL